MSRDASSSCADSDAIAIPPAPNWYGSALADWGSAHGALYAYAARNSIILLRPSDRRTSLGGGGGSSARGNGTTEGTATATAAASFTGTLVGHGNRVTALAFARCGGVEHLLVTGSADKTLRLWDTTARRCVKVLKGHAAEVSAVSTSPTSADLAVSGDRTGKVLVWRFGGGGGGCRAGTDQSHTPGWHFSPRYFAAGTFHHVILRRQNTS
jgi:gem associated protein 5